MALFSFLISVKLPPYIDDIMSPVKIYFCYRKPCRLHWTTYNREDRQ